VGNPNTLLGPKMEDPNLTSLSKWEPRLINRFRWEPRIYQSPTKSKNLAGKKCLIKNGVKEGLLGNPRNFPKSGFALKEGFLGTLQIPCQEREGTPPLVNYQDP